MQDDTRRAMRKLVEAAQERLGEPVLAAGVFSRPGSMANVAIVHVSPLASFVRSHVGKRQSGGLPANVLVAVTEDAVYAFSFRPFYTSVRVKAEVGCWARNEIRVLSTRPGTLATRVVLDVAGRRVELDANAGDRHGVAAAVVDVLRDPYAVSA